MPDYFMTFGGAKQPRLPGRPRPLTPKGPYLTWVHVHEASLGSNAKYYRSCLLRKGTLRGLGGSEHIVFNDIDGRRGFVRIVKGGLQVAEARCIYLGTSAS